MTPQELRSSILQLAIQGKLVEQRPEEGTAEELYQKIQKEKRQLIQEGKIKKEKPLPEIAEDEKPFEIPENWKWVRLGAIGLTHIGLTYSPKDISENGTIVLRSSNIQNSKDGSFTESCLNGIAENIIETKKQIDVILHLLDDSAEYQTARSNWALQWFMMVVTVLSLIVAVITLTDFQINITNIWTNITDFLKNVS